MQTLFRRLGAWGCDIEGARERFLDDEELYADCLRRFAGDPCFAGLPAALEAGDYAAAFDHAHSLKGVAGNLGLTPLYAAVCVLVEHLRAGRHDHAGVLCEAVLREHSRLDEILRGQ